MNGRGFGVARWIVALLLMLACGACVSGQIGGIQPYAPPGLPPVDGPGMAAAVSRWPLRLQTPDGLITIYQPQLRDFDGNQLKGRAAVSVLAPGQPEPVFGAIWLESRVATDRVARTVQIVDTTITQARFPGPGGISAEALTDALRSYRSQQAPVVLSLDQVLAMLQVVQQEKAAVTDIATAPPKILFVNHPAVLVVYDGPPKLMQVENSPLIRAVNTPFFVVLDPPTRTYFLKGASLWYAAANPLGPFQPAAQVPPEVSALAASSGYQDPQAPIADQAPGAVEIITATEPTELVWTDGPEEMATIPNTDLLYVTNTPGDVFLQIDTQQIFVLLSGRWYAAPNHNGPWAYVPPDQLPPDFARIPPQSEKANVLASVAGTQQAKDAIADTYIPQTAAIDRRNFEQPPVQYDGDPQFVSVQQDSPVQYCVNTPAAVLSVDRQYYCCHNAVWFMAGSPLGPWQICASVPAVIYTIPPSCPIYSVRYCHVYESTPDVVYVGYTPGYLGCYHFNHVVVYGTGFHYEPWAGHHYYARPWTYGLAAHYNGYANHWGFEAGSARHGGDAWFPHGEPRGGGAAFFGHGGYRPVVIRNETRVTNVNVRETRVETHVDSLNVYARRHDARSVEHGPAANARPGEPPRRVGPAAPHGGERNDVFAGPNGEVYRKTIDGWEQRQNNRWEPTRSPGGAAGERRAPEPSHEAPRKPVPPRETPGREAPQGEAPSHRPPARQTPAREAPAREAPAHQAPARGTPARPAAPPAELNRDYHARVAGDQRARSYPAPPPPARGPAPAREPAPGRQAPRQPAGGRNTGNPGGDQGQQGSHR